MLPNFYYSYQNWFLWISLSRGFSVRNQLYHRNSMENCILSLKLLYAAIYGWKTGPSSVLHFLQHGYVPPVERGLPLKWGKIQGKSFSVNYVLTVLCVRQQHKNRSLRCSNHFVGFLNLAMHSKGIWLFSVILVECSNHTIALGILKV